LFRDVRSKAEGADLGVADDAPYLLDSIFRGYV
jgi:hypothetical protein